MGSLKQVDPNVTAAPKAVLLQDTLLVHLLTSLHPCFWAPGKGENVLLLVCRFWEWEADLGLGSHCCSLRRAPGQVAIWAGGRPPALHSHLLLQLLPQQVYQGDGPWRACGGCQEAYEKLLGLCQDPQLCWLFWLCSPLVPPPLQGAVLHEQSQSACSPVGKVLCSEKDKNKPAKCWISFSSAGKGSRDSRRSCSSDSKTWVPWEGKEGGEGSLTESTQATQKCLQKQLWICLLEQWMLLVLASCVPSRDFHLI